MFPSPQIKRSQTFDEFAVRLNKLIYLFIYAELEQKHEKDIMRTRSVVVEEDDNLRRVGETEASILTQSWKIMVLPP